MGETQGKGQLANSTDEGRARGMLLSKILTIAITVLGVLYLAAIPLGWVTERFGTTEAIIFVGLLFFNSVLVGRLERLSFSGKGVELQLQQVRQEQVKQQAEISSLKFLISYFVSESELTHLKRLAGHVDPKFSLKDDWDKNIFDNELRRLRSLGLVAMNGSWWIANIPKKGDLKEYCRITDRGLEYLRLREEVQAEQAKPAAS